MSSVPALIIEISGPRHANKEASPKQWPAMVATFLPWPAVGPSPSTPAAAPGASLVSPNQFLHGPVQLSQAAINIQAAPPPASHSEDSLDTTHKHVQIGTIYFWLMHVISDTEL